MKIALLPIGVVFAFGGVAGACAQDVFLHVPLVPGPSGSVGRSTPAPGPTAGRQQSIGSPTASSSMQNRTPDRVEMPVRLGERDETGRIGPSVRAGRDADGRLLPTYRPR